MSEYTKLNSEDTGIYGINKLLNENSSFRQMPSLLSKFQNYQASDKLEITDFGFKNESSNSFINKYNSLSFNRNNEENSTINRTRKGNMKMFLYNGNNEPLIVLGPDWKNSFKILILLIIFIYYYFRFLNNLIYPKIKYYGIILNIIYIILYLICILKNPGIIPESLWLENYFKNKNNDNNKNYSIRICKDCKIIIENSENIEHCNICNICVMEKLFHCFWIGKCIGKNNKYYYYLFVIMTGIMILYLVFSFSSIPFYKE